MPIVHVELYEGRTVDQKRALAKAITKAVSDTEKLAPEATTVIFTDVKKSDWAQGGVLKSDA